MKKNKIILLFLSYHCIAKPISPRIINGLKNIAHIYADQAIAGGIHAAGHLLSAKIAVLMGASVNENKTISYSISLMPYLKIPFGINTHTPDFNHIRVHNMVNLAGPLAGIVGCYLRLKIGNIYTEYDTKKTIAQNIKTGLAKPFYKDHSNLLRYNISFRALVESRRLIPGQHCTL